MLSDETSVKSGELGGLLSGSTWIAGALSAGASIGVLSVGTQAWVKACTSMSSLLRMSSHISQENDLLAYWVKETVRFCLIIIAYVYCWEGSSF
jgi:hypothetical protein